ncbi:MAG TPA: hypothetical protein VGM13_03620 [Thermoanaerobaculia bacterium]|jgi:hypothetical protein
MTMFGAGVVIVAIAIAAVGLSWVLPSWRAYRRRSVVTCPETGAATGIHVDAARVARSAWMGPLDLRLRACARWPERAGCGEECLSQLPVR